MLPSFQLDPTYHLRLLGPVELEQAGAPMPRFESRKAVGLLGYLAVAHKPVARSRLTDLFWPDKTEQQGRANLSRVLNNLSNLLPGSFQADRHFIAFEPADAVWVDLYEFAALQAAGDLPAQLRAIQLYRGDFLEGMFLDDCPEAELWLLAERERCQQCAIGLLETLVTHYVRGGEYGSAQKMATWLLALRPDMEAAHRQLMWLLAKNGQYQAALTQYETCRRFLADELDVAPSPETEALFKALQQGRADQLEPLWLTNAAPTLKPRNPYRGLHAFTEADAPFFFGREAIIDRLETLISQPALVAIIGPSGSGKSSLVHAGLLPRWRTAGDWLTIKLRPGSEPLYALAAVLVPLLPATTLNVDELAAALAEAHLPLRTIIGQMPHGHVLLVIDQFEELYTLCTQPAVRRCFLDALLSLFATQPPSDEQSGPAITVVLTIRADFMGQALAHRSFADLLQTNTFILGPMNRQELTAAIVKPAQQVGVSFEPGLVEHILDDVGHEPGNLPLLEFALTTLWEQQSGGQLSHAAYQAIGRVEGALSAYADQVYDQLPQAEQEQLPRLMRQLVQPGQQTSDTRRLATRTELADSDWQLLQKLADSRLVVTNHSVTHSETAELVHEALINHWQRLQAWIDADRTFCTWHEEFRVALRHWQNSEYSEAGLLHGLGLELAEDWLARRSADFSPSSQAFIQASVARRTKERAWQMRRRRQITTWLVVGLIGAVVLAVLAIWGWGQAETERKAGLSHQLAAQALYNLANGDIDLALLLSLEANRIADTPEALSSLLSGLQQSPYRIVLQGHEYPVKDIAASRNGRQLASVSEDGTVLLWDIPGGQILELLTDGQVRSLAFSPDSELLALGRADGQISLWQASTQREVGQLTGHTGSVTTVTFSADGQRLLSGSADQTLILWDVIRRQPVVELLRGHLGQVESVSFSPDGRLAASGSTVNTWNGADNQVILWDVYTGQIKDRLALADRTNVSSVVFSPDGQLLAVGQTDGYISLWTVQTGEKLGLLPGAYQAGAAPTGRSTIKVAFSPDSRILVAGDEYGYLTMWDVTNRQRVARPFKDHTGAINDLAFTLDGNFLATASNDRSIILWGMTPLLHQTIAQSPSRIWSLATSPDGQLLATGSDNGQVSLWDVHLGRLQQTLNTASLEGLNSLAFSPDGQWLAVGSDDRGVALLPMTATKSTVQYLTGHHGGVNTVAFSQDGKILASGSRDKTVILWDMVSRQPLLPPLAEHTDGVWRVAFSPDGKILASASWDGTVRLWDVPSGQPHGPPLQGHTGAVVSVVFSPDGQTLASGSRDQTIILWNVASGQPLGQPLAGHKDTIWDVAFNPQGQILASAGCSQPDAHLYCSQGEVRLWHVPDGRPLGQAMIGHTDVVWRVSFSPDGQTLISAGDDARIVSWNVNPQSWQKLACNLARRNLTLAEWQQYLGSQPYRATCTFPAVPTTPTNIPTSFIVSKEKEP